MQWRQFTWDSIKWYLKHHTSCRDQQDRHRCLDNESEIVSSPPRTWDVRSGDCPSLSLPAGKYGDRGRAQQPHSSTSPWWVTNQCQWAEKLFEFIPYAAPLFYLSTDVEHKFVTGVDMRTSPNRTLACLVAVLCRLVRCTSVGCPGCLPWTWKWLLLSGSLTGN
jgi:hypothetical protein